MKYIFVILLGILILLYSCNMNKKKSDDFIQQSDVPLNTINDSDVNNTPFVDSISYIRTLDLPFYIMCGLDEYPKSQSTDFIKSLLPENARLTGKFPSYGKYEFLLYWEVGDIGYPYLLVYDNQGQKIDSLFLHIHETGCDGDDQQITVSSARIKSDYSIFISDSTHYISWINDTTLNGIVIDSTQIMEKELEFKGEKGYITACDTSYWIRYDTSSL